MLSDRHFHQQITIVPNLELENREFRLDPTRYNEQGEKVLRHVRLLPYSKARLADWDEVSAIHIPPRFGRIYVEREDTGIPFLGSSSILMLRLPTNLLISRKKTRRLKELEIKDGTIIISRSGTIGVTLICGKSYSGYVASEHCARVYASEEVRGYLQAYIASPLGQALLLQQKHGKVIKEITDDQIGELPVPRPPKHIIKKINEIVLSAVNLYDRTRQSLADAETELYNVLGILGKATMPQLWFEWKNKTFLKMSDSLFNDRLDPHFYDPDIGHVRSTLAALPHKSLGEIANVWGVSRFKRFRADEGHGIPLYSSADIMRANLGPSTYLSTTRNARNIKQCKVKSGTILIPCSGAFGGILGRCVYAGKRLDGKAITQHVLRIRITDPDFIPEYVAALLGSLKYGYPIITALRYGKDVPEIDPDELKSFPIPTLKPEKQEKVARHLRLAYAQLDRANEFENEAQQELLAELEWKD